MSKLYVCLILAFFALASAAPVEDDLKPKMKRIIEIMDAGQEQKMDGSYTFHYRSEDGTFREESAVVVNPGTEEEYLEVKGSYSYFDVNGKEVLVNYKADTHGFVPEGNNIPLQVQMAAKETSKLHTSDKKDKNIKKKKSSEKNEEAEDDD